MPNRSSARVLLAALPAVLFIENLGQALWTGSLLTGLYLAAGLFFSFAGPLFPPRLYRTACYLGFAVLGQAGFGLFGLHPLWIVSLVLLIPEEVLEAREPAVALVKTMVRGIAFYVLLIYVSAFQGLFGDRLFIGIFHLPAGTFLLLLAAAALWQNQPGMKPDKGRPERENA